MVDLEQETASHNPGYDRRSFLTISAGTLAGLALPRRIYARQRNRQPQTRPTQPRQVTESLDQKLQMHLRVLRQKKLKADENVALSVYDLVSGQKLVSIKDSEQVQAASMIKPFVVLAYFNKVEKRELQYSQEVKYAMEMMLQKSDNVATNWVMQLLGGPSQVDKILKTQYGSIFQNIDINDYIPLTLKNKIVAKSRGLKVEGVPSGRSYYSNLASALDYQRFLQGLWSEKLPYSRELKRMMSLPKKNRTVWDVEGIPKNTKIYSRTGTSGRVAGDMAIVESQGNDGKFYPYIFIAIIEKQTPNGLLWTWNRGSLIRGISSKVYQHMKGVYNLK
ncbi:serine hydrolase [Candidatus Woesearchaeota archaeon]|nr:serine hydrolase [Candidatus Woesearchaeota archaeon]